MNIYAKLNAARKQFHAIKLKKSGLNKFAGYEYFELGDFLIPAMEALAANDLCAVISFGTDLATMRIVDVVESTSIEITSPMSTAALKGCHEVQNLGAVQSYLRRYLWVAALEIVEHDAIDSSAGVKKTITTPTGEPLIDSKRLSIIADVADAVKQHMADGDTAGAYEEANGLTDIEEKTALWKLLDSKTRSALKTFSNSLKEAA